ncbi:MAG: tetratricopeptide repeat protein [Candidatus Alcyoniella australis]|nr:tetratricopeptide repeat protein [Candidatus Alcyoniella australis]
MFTNNNCARALILVITGLLLLAGCGPKQVQTAEDPYAQAAQQAQAHSGRTSLDTTGLFQEGVRRFKAGDYQAAAQVWEQLLSVTPPNFVQAYQTHFNLGVAYLRLDQPYNAAPHFARAAGIEPENPKAWVMLGQALLINERFPEAREAVEKALEISPKMPEALITAAAVNYNLGDYPGAATNYENALGVGADVETARQGMAASHLAWGHELLNAGDPSSAVSHLLRAHQLEPDRPEAAYLLGRAYIEMGNLDKGIESLQRAQSIDPDWVAEHRDDFAPYAELGGQNARAHIDVAQNLVDTGKYDLAAAAYEKALEVDWHQPQLQLTLARLYSRQLGQSAPAIEHYRAFITLLPLDAAVPQARKEMELLEGPPEDTAIRMVKVEVGLGRDPLSTDLTATGQSFPIGSEVYRQIVLTGLWGRHVIVKKTYRPGGTLYYAEPIELEFFTKFVRLLSKDRMSSRGTWRQMWYVDAVLVGTVEWTVE